MFIDGNVELHEQTFGEAGSPPNSGIDTEVSMQFQFSNLINSNIYNSDAYVIVIIITIIKSSPIIVIV